MASGREIYVDDNFSYPRDGTAEHPYRKISEAISLANEGDTIYVFGGNYNETLTINKRISIIGGIDDGPSVISFGLSHYYTVEITADFVTLENFTVIDKDHVITSQHGALVHVSSNNVVLQKNNFSYCRMWGLYLNSSNDNTISGNLINATMGVYVSYSNNNVFSNNNISNSSNAGVNMQSSIKNIFYDNRIKTSNFGIYSRDSSNSNITNNTVTKNVFHGVFLIGDKNDIIRGNILRKNVVSGINLDSDGCIISGNTFDSNQIGLSVQRSGCEISNNTFYNASGVGLSTMSQSKNNVISRNHFQKNGVNAREQGRNQWDNGIEGNYWDNYNEIDRNRDGIGDYPYAIATGGVDHYPLGMFLRPPRKPSNPSPADDAENVGLKIILKVKVVDMDSKLLNVYYFNAANDTYLGYARNVVNGTNASFSMTLPFDTTFAWYTIANDSQLENRSDIWFFTTKQRPPENKKPIASPGGPYITKLNQEVAFNGSGSYDPDGRIIFYRWNFGDGSSEILDKNPLHIYSDPGTYIVTLTVVDDDGRSSMANTTVVVSGIIYSSNPPVAQFYATPSPGTTSQTITFNASLSNDIGGTIVGYRWDFDGDNVSDTDWLTSPTTAHSYPTPGTYIVQLEVKNNDNLNGFYSMSIMVNAAQKKSPGFEVPFALLALSSFLLIYLRKKR
jgi:parallel beta-helix repeat protein